MKRALILPCACCGLEAHSGRLTSLAELLLMKYPDMTIASGTRCEKRNADVGGSRTSGHLPVWGEDGKHSVAFDGRLERRWDRFRRRQFVFDAIRAGAKGVILYDGHFHVDLKPRLYLARTVNGALVPFP